MDEVLQEFLAESQEGLTQMENDLVLLEREPQNGEAIGRLFRVTHTIKGTCGFLGYEKLQRVAHVSESLLDRLRDKKLLVNREIADALLVSLDVFRAILATLEQTGGEGNEDYAAHVARLKRLTESAPDVPVASEAQPLPAAAAASGHAGGSETHVRMPVATLDSLMNQVGELVLTRNRLLQFMSAHDTSEGTAIGQTLDGLTTQLEEGVRKTRMQSVGSLFTKLPRVVRDLAASLGKEVRLAMEGEDTELDRSLIEAIRDPLTHMVRNSLDHGIERPEIRAAKGKPREGTLQLRARHQAGQVVIEIADDGGGIDLEKVKIKAVSVGLLTAAQAAELDDRSAAALIFAPGLSTAEKVTDVSGRGVGMDVVQSNIKRINGSIEIETHLGKGTTFQIKVPLTLAVLPAFIVACGEQSYAIPEASLLEVVPLEGQKHKTAIEMFHGAPVFRLRGTLRSIVDLREQLGLPRLAAEGRRYIAVLQAEGRQFGLVVDSVGDVHGIVVKPLSPQLRGIAAFAGATILGDGTVALILDVEGLAKQGNVLRPEGPEAQSAAQAAPPSGPSQQLVVFRVGEDGRMAVPMALVTRLEQFENAAIESAGEFPAVSYQGEAMPLVRLSAAMPERRQRPRTIYTGEAADESAPAKTNVMVYFDGTRRIGVVVEEILDIVETSADLDQTTLRKHVLGTAVIAGRATELVDLPAVVKEAMLPGEVQA